MTGNEIYKRTLAYEREARSIRLHAPEWKLLLAFDGLSSLSEVALGTGLTFTEALPVTQKFLNLDWIEEQPITLDQYLQRSGATAVVATPAAPSAVVLEEDEPEIETEPDPAPQPDAESSPGVPIASTPPPLSAAPAARLPRGPMRLGSVVDYITSLAGTIPLGQLLVYRVFLRVPAELLQAEDIVSVHLVNDTSLIRGTALQQAIAQAVQDVAKRPLPEGVFAPA